MNSIDWKWIAPMKWAGFVKEDKKTSHIATVTKHEGVYKIWLDLGQGFQELTSPVVDASYPPSSARNLAQNAWDHHCEASK